MLGRTNSYMQVSGCSLAGQGAPWARIFLACSSNSIIFGVLFHRLRRVVDAVGWDFSALVQKNVEVESGRLKGRLAVCLAFTVGVFT